MTMHFWGDEWFKEHGDELHGAIRDLEKRIHKWALCGVYGKEKYGTYRDEYFRMWSGGLSDILFGYRLYHDGWFQNVIWHIDHVLIPVRRTRFGWLHAGLADFNRWIGLVPLVHRWQARMVNKAYQVTCAEHPGIIDELICDTSTYGMVKPCKWGDVDGRAIHDRYWKTID